MRGERLLLHLNNRAIICKELLRERVKALNSIFLKKIISSTIYFSLGFTNLVYPVFAADPSSSWPLLSFDEDEEEDVRSVRAQPQVNLKPWDQTFSHISDSEIEAAATLSQVVPGTMVPVLPGVATWGGIPTAPPSGARGATASSSVSPSQRSVSTGFFDAPSSKNYHLPILTNVSTVDLRGNKITSKSGELILRLAQENPTLCEIHLDERDLHPGVVEKIKAQLQANRVLIAGPSQSADVVPKWLDDLMSMKYIEPKDQPLTRHGLSIDGGGMKGLIPAQHLSRIQGVIERMRAMKQVISYYDGPKRQIQDVFDGFGGSSIGGVLALGLAKPNPIAPDQLVSLFRDDGKKIFGKKIPFSFGGKVQHRYEPEALERLLQDYFKDQTLKDVSNVLVITGVRTDLPEGLVPYLFDSRRAQSDQESNFLLSSVARATAAAPTFFPRALIRNCSPQRDLYQFWDGGVWRNDPAELLLNKMTQEFPGERIKIFSLGTGQPEPRYQPVWADGAIGNISPLLWGQMDLSANVSGVMRGRIGVNYMRFQPLLVDHNGSPLTVEMDDTSPEILRRYEALANNLWEKEKMEEIVRKICEEAAITRDSSR